MYSSREMQLFKKVVQRTPKMMGFYTDIQFYCGFKPKFEGKMRFYEQ